MQLAPTRMATAQAIHLPVLRHVHGVSSALTPDYRLGEPRRFSGNRLSCHSGEKSLISGEPETSATAFPLPSMASSSRQSLPGWIPRYHLRPCGRGSSLISYIFAALLWDQERSCLQTP